MLLPRPPSVACPANRPTTRSRAATGSVRVNVLLHNQGDEPFDERMLQLEAVLPSMSCSQLAQTGTSLRETYLAALLSTEAERSSGSSGQQDATATRDLLDYFTSQLPNQSWLLTYRAAVQQHIDPGVHAAAAPATVDDHGGSETQSSSSNAATHNSQVQGLACSPEHLAEILAAVATMPIQVVQPLPIGFGTPRWSRPLAAADPAAWEQWLTQLTLAYTALLEQQLLLQQQEQQTSPQQWEQPAAAANTTAAAGGGQHAWQASSSSPPPPSPELLQQLSDFIISLVCSMRWVNVNVDDDRLQTQEFRERVLICLQQQQQEMQQVLVSVPQEQQPPRVHTSYQQGQMPDDADSASLLQTAADEQQPWSNRQHKQQQQRGRAAFFQETDVVPSQLQQVQQQPHAQQQQDHHHYKHQVPFALSGSLCHRLTYTCLLLLLPPPRPMLSAFFQATQPSAFSLEQLQGIVRGLLFVGCAPPVPWLQGLVQLVRARAGDLSQADMMVFVEGYRFFGTQVGRAPWLRDATALLEEFSCVG